MKRFTNELTRLVYETMSGKDKIYYFQLIGHLLVDYDIRDGHDMHLIVGGVVDELERDLGGDALLNSFKAYADEEDGLRMRVLDQMVTYSVECVIDWECIAKALIKERVRTIENRTSARAVKPSRSRRS